MLVRDVVNAIRKNGWQQTRGVFFRDSAYRMVPNRRWTKRIVSACALGQAAINLNVNPYKLTLALDAVIPKNETNYTYSRLGQRIMRMNDTDYLPLEQIANIIEQEYQQYLDLPVEIK